MTNISLKKIWIDLDNTPHVPFFAPIIHELENRGFQVVLTARDAFQVCELADEKGLSYVKIGRHFGRNIILKIFGVFWRSALMFAYYLRHRPRLALSHGSRSLNMIGNLVGIPTVALSDYEHTRTIPLASPRWIIVAYPLIAERVSHKKGRIRFYHGIKEDVYVSDFNPDPTFLKRFDFSTDELLITVRPPASEAHYHNPQSESLLVELMKRIGQTAGARAVLLPRNRRQAQTLRVKYPTWFADRRTIIPQHAVDGLNLLWFSDLVVSGGGTMNREAAALGVPVYSIFRGKTGAVDRMLEREGRLTMIHSVDEVWTKIKFFKRDKNMSFESPPRTALDDIIKNIEEIIQIEQSRYKKSIP